MSYGHDFGKGIVKGETFFPVIFAGWQGPRWTDREMSMKVQVECPYCGHYNEAELRVTAETINCGGCRQLYLGYLQVKPKTVKLSDKQLEILDGRPED